LDLEAGSAGRHAHAQLRARNAPSPPPPLHLLGGPLTRYETDRMAMGRFCTSLLPALYCMLLHSAIQLAVVVRPARNRNSSSEMPLDATNDAS
jgi:hypothetical protein